MDGGRTDGGPTGTDAVTNEPEGGPVLDGPVLPEVEAKPPPPMAAPLTPAGSSSAWYRNDQDRARSVYRRANPWYRRLARGVIALVITGLFGVGLYAGARALQDYLDRERLPAAGLEVPDVRRSSFEIRSTAPAPALDGTITVDVGTGAYEFLGRVGGPQSGLQIVDPGDGVVAVRQGANPWRPADATDGGVPAIAAILPYLRVDSPDDVLTNRLRRGYVELAAQVGEGEGADELTRYELVVDTAEFATDYPLQWDSFRDQVVPTLAEEPAAALTMWLDDDDLVVRLRDEVSGWTWQRLAYDTAPFVPADPLGGATPPPADTTAGTTADTTDAVSSP